MLDLSTNFAGLDLKNPIIVGSSGLTDNIETIINLEKNGAAGIILKSLFEEEILKETQTFLTKMNSTGYIYPETLNFYDDLRYNTKFKTEKYLELIATCKKGLKIPLIASINCITPEEWTYFPQEIENAGADALELNLFILPSDLYRTGSENEQIYFDIITQVKKHTKLPLIIKMSPYFSNLAQIIHSISQSGVQGIVLFNRFYSPDIDIDTFEITQNNALSQPSDIYLSLRWIGIMANRIECDLAASTGIHNYEGIIKQLLAGASAVEIVSALYKKGPGIINQLIIDLQNYMNRKKITSLKEIKGKMSMDKSNDPAAYERVQFMKYVKKHTKK